MAEQVRIALAQLNFTVGDILGNTNKIIQTIENAKTKLKAHAIVFPELALTGYPPEDLLYRPQVYAFIDEALEQIKQLSTKITIIVGHPINKNGYLYNSASIFKDKKLISSYDKKILPNKGVFDEVRYFEPGNKNCFIEINHIKYAILICEDIWLPEPIKQAKEQGAQCVLVLNASPYSQIKHEKRLSMLNQRVKEMELPILYLNQISGQDDLIFDGGSLVINQYHEVCCQAEFFKEQLLCADIEHDTKTNTLNIVKQPHPKSLTPIESIYSALKLGIQDYTLKNGFKNVLVSLSGGIDSSLTLTLAVDALGPEHASALMMPTQYTSSISIEDSKRLTQTLGVPLEIIDIQSQYEHFLKTLSPCFKDLDPDVTEENIQARARAIILMALSNKFNKLVLSTGNKSEYAVGYCTLYGDMVGGLCVLKDVYKTLAYKLALYRNELSPVIPQRIIDRPPSAELKPNQTDQNTLPPYDILDQILEMFIEQDMSMNDIIHQGFDKHTVETTVNRVLRSEFKRRQSPPGIRITEKIFGRDRRYPITSGYLKNIML